MKEQCLKQIIKQSRHIRRSYFRRATALAAAVILMLFSAINCLAADVGYSLRVDNKVQTGKSFKTKIAVSGGSRLAAMIFTLCFDSSVMEFSSASLCEGAAGQIEEYCENGNLKIVYLNTRGISSAGDSEIIEVKFKALDNPCTAFLSLYGEQAVSADEKRLSCDYGFEYTVELQEKISGAVGQASAAEIKKSSSSSSGDSKSSSKDKSSSSKSSSKSPKSSKSDSGSDGSYGTHSALTESGEAVSLGSASDTQSDNTLFICGFVAAICVVCLAAAIYAFGKKRGEMKIAKSAEKAKDADEDKDKNEYKDEYKDSDMSGEN